MELTLDEALQKGIEAHQNGQVQEADHFYTAVLKAHSKHPDANHNMGVLAVGVGKTQESLPFFKTALEANPSIVKFWLSYIDALIKLDRITDAKAVFDQAKDKGANGGAFDQLEQLLALQLLAGNTAGVPQDPCSEQLQPIINLYTQGQLQQALSCAKQALERFPDSLVLYNLAGAANAGLMQFDAAIESFKQALRIKPNYADAYYNIGIALNGKGDLEAAIDSYKQALKFKPNYAGAYYNMGNALNDKGDLEAAIDSYNEALKIKPDYADAYYNMGNALKDKGDLDSAINCYQQALKINPDYAEAYNNMGSILQSRGDLEAAIDSFKQALTFKTDYAEALNNMGAALNDKGDIEAAINSFKQAIKIKPDYAEALNNMGNILYDKGDLNAAIDYYNQALEFKPDYAEAYNHMGAALNDKGDIEAAINSFKQAIKIKPDYAEAYRHLGILSRYHEHDEYFIRMQSLCIGQCISDEQRCHFNFALSKASEDLNEISQSFTYLKTGNELRKKILSYDVRQDIELFTQIKKSFPDIAKAALQPDVEASELKPIFILGMPRSGTTLVEQIISSHSKVSGAGELSYVDQLGRSIAKGMIRPHTDIITNFRNKYIEALKKSSGSSPIWTDKMPQNFRYVGLILSAFPNAKVVHVNRDPAATCWSNYKHYFIAKGLGYSHSLDDIVAYFGLYKDLMQLWQEHYGERIYNLNYENLAINQEAETKNLVKYLGLEWEDVCLSPQNNKRIPHTASQQQVRQKIYQGSSQQWRKFEPYLKGSFDQLEQQTSKANQVLDQVP